MSEATGKAWGERRAAPSGDPAAPNGEPAAPNGEPAAPSGEPAGTAHGGPSR
jgi:hypothetical protein